MRRAPGRKLWSSSEIYGGGGASGAFGRGLPAGPRARYWVLLGVIGRGIPTRPALLPLLGRDIGQYRPAARDARVPIGVVRLVVALRPGAISYLCRRLPLRPRSVRRQRRGRDRERTPILSRPRDARGGEFAIGAPPRPFVRATPSTQGIYTQAFSLPPWPEDKSPWRYLLRCRSSSLQDLSSSGTLLY